MIELAAVAGVSAELEQARIELRSVAGRVAEAAQSAPRRDASGWDGRAAHAYQRSLDQLGRQLEEAQELTRTATELVEAALFELGGHA